MLASADQMREVHLIPIRGKPRTLERTMMGDVFVDGGRERRAMGPLTNFWRFYTPGLELPSEETRVLGIDHTISARLNAAFDRERAL